uniref:Uncharacterized protein n=1 Tax=Meloidogyne enterolobii TaxID=390850 RepID=A0A6V7WP48_MELEN|nr:unnamed protein product [Meloidogyne enterolobii]
MIITLLINLIKCLSFTGTADAPIMIDESTNTEMLVDNVCEEKDLGTSQESSGLEVSMTAEEIQEVRAFILEQKKKKQAAEARRRRSIEKSSSTLSSVSTSSKAPTAKKAQSKSNKISENVPQNNVDAVIKSIIKRSKSQNVKHSKEEDPAIIEALIDYDEEEDDSDDPDPNDVISLGEDEEEYKRRRIERKFDIFLFKYFLGKQRAEQLVPEGLLNRAQILKEPRRGIFIHQCNDCRENQKKRQKFLYNAGSAMNFMLTFELCVEDLDKNINLGVY